jgi:hypothetical protein
MTRTQRRWLDPFIAFAAYAALYTAGAGYWALLVFPFGLWCWWDGTQRAAEIVEDRIADIVKGRT